MDTNRKQRAVPVSYAYNQRGPNRLIGLVGVVALHGVLLWLLVSGLGQSAIKIVSAPMEAWVVEETPAEPEAPPPPPEIPLPEVVVPLPEVAVVTPAEAPVTAITAAVVPVDQLRPPSNEAKPAVGNRRPDYPASSRRLGQEGTVVLLLFVNTDGKVTDAKIEKSSGFQRLDDSAVKEALKSWRFQPPTEGGKPVTAWQRFAVTFRLTDS